MILSKHFLKIKNFFKNSSADFRISCYFAIFVILPLYTLYSCLSINYILGLNMSDSFKEKVFIFKKGINEKLFRDEIVYAIPPQNIYVPKGKMIIKKIACLPGNTLEVKGKDYFCNSKLIATAQTLDSKKREIKQFYFSKGVIPNNYFFIVGMAPNSFDSRYFGLISAKDIKGISIWKF